MLKHLKGETKLIATVKAEIDVPDFKMPNGGKLDFYVDWFVVVILKKNSKNIII